MFMLTINAHAGGGMMCKCRNAEKGMRKGTSAEDHGAGAAGARLSAVRNMALRYRTATATVHTAPPIIYTEWSRRSPICDPRMKEVTTMVMNSPGRAVMREYHFLPDTIR